MTGFRSIGELSRDVIDRLGIDPANHEPGGRRFAGGAGRQEGKPVRAKVMSDQSVSHPVLVEGSQLATAGARFE